MNISTRATAKPGGTAKNGSIIVSSETNPDAKNISVSLEEGYYNFRYSLEYDAQARGHSRVVGSQQPGERFAWKKSDC